jgi:hypothetical protein
MALGDLMTILVILAAWLVLMRYVLPRWGITT